jgi:hypothetical protein
MDKPSFDFWKVRTVPDGLNCLLPAKGKLLSNQTGREWGDDALVLLVASSKGHPESLMLLVLNDEQMLEERCRLAMIRLQRYASMHLLEQDPRPWAEDERKVLPDNGGWVLRSPIDLRILQ